MVFQPIDCPVVFCRAQIDHASRFHRFDPLGRLPLGSLPGSYRISFLSVLDSAFEWSISGVVSHETVYPGEWSFLYRESADPESTDSSRFVSLLAVGTQLMIGNRKE